MADSDPKREKIDADKRAAAEAAAEKAVAQQKSEMAAELAAWCAAVSAADPTGPDLRYESKEEKYRALFLLAKGKPETQRWDGAGAAESVPAEDPKWSAVREGCVGILARSKDLGVAVLLTVAEFKTSGLPGLATALTLIATLLEKYQATVWPRPDPDDGDITERLNVLRAMSPPPETFEDPLRLKKRIREEPLVESVQHGRFSLKDIDAAGAKTPPPAAAGVAVANLQVISAAFDQLPAAVLRYRRDSATAAVEATLAIDKFASSATDSHQTLELDGLRSVLMEVKVALTAQMVRRGLEAGSSAAGTGGDSGGNSTGHDAGLLPGVAPVGPSIPGQIRSRQDVIDCLKRISAYYAAYEPSSPIPLLIDRASRLVSKSFVDIVRDLVPNTLGDLSVISGVDHKATGKDDD